MTDLNLIIGIAGMALLLTGFALNILKLRTEDTYTYIVLNIAGGGMSTCYAASLHAVPFIILEAIWTAFAIYKMIAVLLRRRA